jgi:hypothetical protein
MAAPRIIVKTGSERENCYRFCRILVDIGNKIARDYVGKIILSYGYNPISEFFQENRDLIKEFPDKLGNYIKGKLIKKNNHLDGVIRVINNPEFNDTLDLFDIGACSSIIQNMLASNSKYLKYFNSIHKKDPNKCKLSFDKSHSLDKLRELRNASFGHIFVFKMEASDFEQEINKIDGIFYDLNNKSYSHRNEINKVMNETLIEDKILKYLENILKDLIQDRNLIKDFLDSFKYKINEDRENFQTIIKLISEIDLDELKKSLETKIINLSNEIKINKKASLMILSDGFKHNLKEHKKTQDSIKE